MSQFIDGRRLIESSLLNLVKIFWKEFIELNANSDTIKKKKSETCGIKYKYIDFFLEHTNFEDILIE